MFQYFHSIYPVIDSLSLFLFWAGIIIVGYTYLGYAAVLFVLSRLRRARKPAGEWTDNALPKVTLVIAAYNEEQCIEEKLINTLSLDYPEDKLAVFVVTDGSTDNTPEIVKKFHAVRLFHDFERRGKIHAVNRVMKHVSTPIVVYTDANTLLNPEALRKLIRHFVDENVGGVAGEKQIFRNTADNASGAGEGLYWRYESYLKARDAEVWSIVGAAGELFSIRTALYEEPLEDTVIEDFFLSMRICARGYRFMYEPEATALETASASVEEEWKRKVRICAGGFQAITRMPYLLNPFRYGVLTFQYISHRVLRWTLAPLFLPIILLTNVWLALDGNPLYLTLLAGQLLFYGLALAGRALRDRKVSIKGFFVPYYFVVMNLSVYAGLYRFLRGRQPVVWEKARRASVAPQSIKP